MSKNGPSAPGPALTVGIDVGGSRTRVGAVDALGRVHSLMTSPTPRGHEPFVDHLVSAVAEIAERTPSRPMACGVGVPGKLDMHGVLSLAINLEIQRPIAIRARLEERLGMPVRVSNDVNLAALGAARLAGLERGTLYFLNVGTGLAAGYCIDGVVHTGSSGGAGEVGHMPLTGDRKPCRCGQRGCAEMTASGSAIVARWGHPDASVEDVWDAADSGDGLAQSIRSDALDALAALVLCGVLMLDPDIVMLGGGVTGLGDRLRLPLIERLGEAADDSSLVASYGALERLELADPSTEYGVLGASWLARI